jgi:hypothetical protein
LSAGLARPSSAVRFCGSHLNKTIMSQEKNEVAAQVLPMISPKDVQNTLDTINTSVTKNLAALSVIKKIETDADDAKAEKLLVATRATFNKVQGLRMPITQALNAMIDTLIEPENKISNDAKKKDSEYNRIKQLRDEYANAKFKKQQAEKQRIKLEQVKKDELIRLKTEAEKMFLEYMQSTLLQLEQTISGLINNVKLAEWESLEKKFNAKPQLKKETFEAKMKELESIAVDEVVTKEEFDELFLAVVKEQYTYEFFNAEYVRQAQPIINSWKAKLPERKKELEKISKLQETNALAAKAESDRIARRQEEEQIKLQEAADKKLQEEKDELERKQAEERLNNQFEATVQAQVISEAVPGITVRRAKITCEPKKIVQVLSKVMFACYSNPKFEGHIKKNEVDADGIPVYADWAQTLLTFYAKNCEPTVEGIEIIETKSTTARKK